MSLLLDALKKAAEQKAQKSKLEETEKRSSDETLLDVAGADDASRLADDGARRSARADETQLDRSEVRERVEPGKRSDGDDTGVDIRETTDTGFDQRHRETPGDDETGLDVSDATATRHRHERTSRAGGDETGLDYPQSSGARSADASARMRTGEDETIVFGSEDVADFGADPELDSRRPLPRDDETDLSQIDDAADQQDADRSEIQAEAQPDSGQAPQHDDDTDSAEAGQSRREQASEVDAGGAADDEPGNEYFVEEDLSLLLVEPEPDSPAADTAFTDPQVAADRQRALAEGGPDTSGLELADDTQTRTPGETTDTQSPTRTNVTATALFGDDTRTSSVAIPVPRQSTVTRPDQTSTRTYAPDNYDRTLMKLPNDDASKLFAGMKSDSDVVMTPEHAKKIFRSKTSAQRARHYKYYAGIAVVLLLAIIIYGAVEYQDESYAIDNSLRPLKRDPMPGVISSQQQQQGTDLFAQSDGQVDARTIEIVESAAVSPEPIASEPEEPAGEGAAAEPEAPTQQTEVAMASQSSEPAAQAAEPEARPQPRPQPDSRSGEDAAAGEPATANLGEQARNLQIATSSQYRQADIWLREAYLAYRAGDVGLAMQRYNQVLEVDPGNRNALLARAAINVQKGNIEAAIRDYQALLLANPRDSVAMSSLLGIASYSPRETESQLKLMLREEPESPYLNFALANAYGAQNRWQEAQLFYFRALQNNPEDPNYAYNLAVSLEHIAQPRSAITYYQRALENFDKGLANFSRELVDQRLQLLEKL